MLDIKFRFTCGESNLCQHNLKFQNIMTKIVVFMLLTLKMVITTSSPAHILAIRRRRIFLNCSGGEVMATTKTYFRHYDIGIKTGIKTDIRIKNVLYYTCHCTGIFPHSYAYPTLFSIKTSHYETNNMFYVKS